MGQRRLGLAFEFVLALSTYFDHSQFNASFWEEVAVDPNPELSWEPKQRVSLGCRHCDMMTAGFEQCKQVLYQSTSGGRFGDRLPK